MERGERLEMGAHVVLFKLLQQGNHSLVVRRLRWEGDLLRSNLLAENAEVIGVRDVEEVDVLLALSARLGLSLLPLKGYIHDAEPTSRPRSPIASHQETAQSGTGPAHRSSLVGSGRRPEAPLGSQLLQPVQRQTEIVGLKTSWFLVTRGVKWMDVVVTRVP